MTGTRTVLGEIVRACGHPEAIYIPPGMSQRELKSWTNWSMKSPCHQCRLDNVRSHGYRVIPDAKGCPDG
jgi:hypothetical protein